LVRWTIFAGDEVSALSRYISYWDQSRARAGRDYCYEDEEIIIATDFECGSGRGIRRLGENQFQMHCEADPPGSHPFSGKSTYFCLGIKNKRNTRRRIMLTLLGFSHDLKEVQSITVRAGRAWRQLPASDILPSPQSGSLTLRATLPPEVPLFLCNFHWYPYTEMCRYLEETARRFPFASLSSIGKTYLGRDILVLTIAENAKSRPCVVVASTPQPSESGHWASRAVIDFLTSDAEEALAIRRANSVHILPHTNPDGTVLGYGMSNSLGQAPYFDADCAADGREASRESVLMWNFLKSKRPWLYLEFHSAFQAYRKTHAILRYDKALLRGESTRRLMEECDKALESLPGNFTESVTNRQKGYHNSMGFAAMTKLGVISYMYKLHDKFPLEENLLHSQEVFRRLMTIALGGPCRFSTACHGKSLQMTENLCK